MGPASATPEQRPYERDSNLHEMWWLGEEDSNPRYEVQSHASYH